MKDNVISFAFVGVLAILCIALGMVENAILIVNFNILVVLYEMKGKMK